jgi:hypothetical protein
MKLKETLRGIIREEIKKVVERIEITGDYNDADFRGPAKKAAAAYLKTTEGMRAAKIFKSLVTNQFDASDLTSAIKAGKFKKTNDFKAAAAAGGLELSGVGNVDNQGNGDFEVLNQNYIDQGAAIAFFNNKFYSVG